MITTAFFDLDGTLTNPAEGFLNAVKAGFAAIDRPPPADAALTKWIGPPLVESLTNHLGDARLAADALEGYRATYGVAGYRENHVYDGIEACLDGLLSQGLRLFVATAKPEPMARKVLAHFQLTPRFINIFGPSYEGELNDKADLLARALKVTGENPATSVMIGDRRYDMRAGRKNNVRAIGVTYGHGSAEELTTEGAFALAHHASEIWPILRDMA